MSYENRWIKLIVFIWRLWYTLHFIPGECTWMWLLKPLTTNKNWILSPLEEICIPLKLLTILKMNHWRSREKQDEENGYKISAIELNKVKEILKSQLNFLLLLDLNVIGTVKNKLKKWGGNLLPTYLLTSSLRIGVHARVWLCIILSNLWSYKDLS